MAITINTRPNELSTNGIFKATTNQAEDATHVNVRVESELMYEATAIAKKVKPLALDTHDYTEILRTLVGFSDPTPFDDADTVGILDPGKTGSNLITTLNNYATSFSTFSATGNVLNSALTATAVTGTIQTNAIAVTKGKIYVLVATGITPTGTPTLSIGETSGIGVNLYSGISTANAVFRVLLQPRTSGNISISIQKTAQIGGIGTTTFTMYEMNPCNWYVPYYIKFTEKWEDESGVTQTGSSTTDTLLRFFFDMPNVSQDVIAYYILGTSTDKFMMNSAGENSDGTTKYLSTNFDRSINVYENKPGTTKVNHFIPFIVDTYTCRLRINYELFSESGSLLSSLTSGSYITYYSPILILKLNKSINYYLPLTYYSFRSMPYIQRELSDAQISEKIPVIIDTRYFQELYSIVWKNDKGGWSTAVFTSYREQDRKSDRVQMKNSTGLSKTLSSTNRNVVNLKKKISGSETQLSYLADILDSKQVFWHRGAGDFVPINITKDTIVMKSSNLEYPEIDFEYIP